MARILIADDIAIFLETQAKVLRHSGHEVATALNGNEALRLMETGAFDLVIIDIIMPEKEGLETIVELRRKYPKLKIIAMSGGGRVNPAGYLHVARLLGAARTLDKPFTIKQLEDAVAEVLQAKE